MVDLSIAMLVYQRVISPQKKTRPWFSACGIVSINSRKPRRTVRFSSTDPWQAGKRWPCLGKIWKNVWKTIPCLGNPIFLKIVQAVQFSTFRFGIRLDSVREILLWYIPQDFKRKGFRSTQSSGMPRGDQPLHFGQKLNGWRVIPFFPRAPSALPGWTGTTWPAS